MGTAPSISRRALAAALAFGTGAFSLATGCSLRGRHLGDVRIGDSDAAVRYALSSLSKKHGGRFEALSVEEDPPTKWSSDTVYDILSVPAQGRPRPFQAMIAADSGTGRLTMGLRDDYSQYLFSDRAVEPFRDALRSRRDVAGYGLRLTYVHMDARDWRAGDYEAYMGEGLPGDPEVEAAILFPRGWSADQYAAAAKGCIDTLYALERSMSVYLGVEGLDPYRSGLRPADVDEMYPATRRPSPPSEEQLARDIRDSMDNPAPQVPWDGNGNPDGKPRDPAAAGSYPTVHWNPGHGPSTWK